MAKLYYWKNGHILLVFNTDKITRENMKETHVEMPINLEVSTPEDAFVIFNDAGIVENPLSTPENQQFIRNAGTHTSMSVGDIVEIKGVMYLCEDIGWRELRE